MADPSEFGSFHFEIWLFWKRQNKDVINRLKTEHLEHRGSFSTSSSSESTPTGRLRGFSFGNAGNSGSSVVVEVEVEVGLGQVAHHLNVQFLHHRLMPINQVD